MKILIYGTGGMGKIFRDFFSTRGYHVRCYDINREISEIEEREVTDFDVIFLCVPMDSIEEAVKRISELNRKALVVDIATIKSTSIPFLEKHCLEYMSIHPMFGPESEIGLSNIIVVERSGRYEEDIILEEFRKAGTIISSLPYKEHDRKMAEIQGTAHFLLFLFALSLRDKFMDRYEIASPIFLVMHKLASRIINQDWRMYYHILKNAEKTRFEIEKNAKLLNEVLKSREDFRLLIEELRTEFNNYRDSTFILDSYKATVEVKSIDELRGYIRALDSLILRLIENRVFAGKKVALEKKRLNEPVEISQIEDVKIREITGKTSLNPLYISEIFENIMKLTKEEEYRTIGIKRKIAVLGPHGSYTEEAALRLTGSRLPIIYRNSVEDVFKAVESGEADFGLVPVENSLHGTVIQTLDSLMKHSVEVFAEYESEIRHNLVGKRKLSLKEIKTIFSHPQAIAQCSEFINNYIPHAEIRYTRSTSEAIEMLDDASAAIASELAAKLYKLHIIKRDIQTKTPNRTRFYIIRRHIGDSEDGDVTCIFFGVDDRPGALYSVLEVFYRHGINLRKLESRPSGNRLGDYVFFAEAEKRLDEEIVEQLKTRTTFCKIAGVFKKIESLDVFSNASATKV